MSGRRNRLGKLEERISSSIVRLLLVSTILALAHVILPNRRLGCRQEEIQEGP